MHFVLILVAIYVLLFIILTFMFHSKVSRPDKLPVHVFEVDEDVDKDEVSFHLFPRDKSLW